MREFFRRTSCASGRDELGGDDVDRGGLRRLELVERLAEDPPSDHLAVVDGGGVLQLGLGELVDDEQLGVSRSRDLLRRVGGRDEEVVDDQLRDVPGGTGRHVAEHRLRELRLLLAEGGLLGESRLLGGFPTFGGLLEPVLTHPIEQRGLVARDGAVLVLVATTALGLRTRLGQVLGRAQALGLVVLLACHDVLPNCRWCDFDGRNFWISTNFRG